MRPILFALSVFSLFLGEVLWAAWHDDDGPLTQLAGNAVHDANDLSSLRDPLHGWTGENKTLDAILASAVWPTCVGPACGSHQTTSEQRL